MKRCKHCDDYITGKRAKSHNVLFCSAICRCTYVKEKRGEKPPWVRLRFEVLARDNFTCQYCGRTAKEVELQVDHIYPKVKGGNNDKDNLIASCIDCNKGKGDILLPLQLIKTLQNH